MSIRNANQKAGHQFRINLFSNITAFVVKALQGILFTPFLVRFLGIEVYGFIGLAVSLTGYFGLVTASVSSSLTRYLTIDIQKRDVVSANDFFNTSLLLVLIAGLPLLLVTAWICLHIDRFFQMPDYLFTEVGLLFGGIIGSFAVGVIISIFNVSAYANNRLDICNFIDIGNIAVRVSLIFLLFVFWKAALWLVGLSYFIGAVAAAGLSIFYWARLTPFLKLRFQAVKGKVLRQLFAFSGWLSLDQLGTLLLLNCELIIVNRLLGPVAGGEYTLVLQWSSFLWAIAAVFTTLLTPMIYGQYASGDLTKMIRTSRSSLRFVGLIMALPIGLLCGFAKPLLALWAGPEYVRLGPLLWLVLGHLVVNLAVTPLFAVNRAFNALKVPALMTVLSGIGCVGLAMLLIYYTDWGIYGMAWAVAVMLSVRNLLFLPLYTGRLLGITGGVLIRELIPGLIAMVIVIMAAGGLNQLQAASSWYWMGFHSSVIGVLYLAIAAVLPGKTGQACLQN